MVEWDRRVILKNETYKMTLDKILRRELKKKQKRFGKARIKFFETFTVHFGIKEYAKREHEYVEAGKDYHDYVDRFGMPDS